MPRRRKNFRQTSVINPSALGVDRTIVLVGLMGVGKTTVGRRLAKKLGMDFVDSDHEIEKAADMTISEIFEEYGEEDFRAGERQVISRLLDGNPQVIATGGGAFINQETRRMIKDKGLSIWLDADIDTLVERTGRRDTRPLLKQGDPKEILTKLANERSPLYGKADLKVMSGAGPHETVVDNILQALKDRETR